MRKVIIAAIAATWAQAAAAAPLPKGEGMDTVRRECSRCHSLRNLVQADGFTAEEWRAFVIRMTELERRPAALDAVVAYLAAHFPPYRR